MHLQLAGVDVRFGDLDALRGVDLEIASGEFCTLLGPSGCGKTTILRLINGLVRPTAGSVRVEGDEPSVARMAKRFSLVPQTPALLPWRSVRRNVQLIGEVNRRGGGAVSDDVADELLSSVGLSEFADALPHTLSGGMAQRVALARAFASGAPVLLMDEPFAALDEITRTEMRSLLTELWLRTKPTVVFVTHSITEATILSDRVAVLASRPGRITAIEPISLPRPRPEEIEDTPEFTAHTARLRAALHAGFDR